VKVVTTWGLTTHGGHATVVVLAIIIVVVALLEDEEEEEVEDALLASTACKYLGLPTSLESSFKRRSGPAEGPLDPSLGPALAPALGVGAPVVDVVAFPVDMVVVGSHEQESTACDGTLNN